VRREPMGEGVRVAKQSVELPSALAETGKPWLSFSRPGLRRAARFGRVASRASTSFGSKRNGVRSRLVTATHRRQRGGLSGLDGARCS
jgi:hypothetical protein